MYRADGLRVIDPQGRVYDTHVTEEAAKRQAEALSKRCLMSQLSLLSPEERAEVLRAALK